MSTISPDVAAPVTTTCPTFTVDADALMALAAVGRMAMLNARPLVRVTVAGDVATVHTDGAGNHTIQQTVPVTDATDGTCILPGNALADLKGLKVAAGTTFAPNETATRMKVTAGRRRGHIALVNQDVRPLGHLDGVSVTLPADELVTMLAGITKAVGMGSTDAVNLSVADGALVVVTTDGTRMFHRSATVESDRSAEAYVKPETVDSFLLPTLKAHAGEVATVRFTDRNLTIVVGNTTMEAATVPLTAKSFPDWRPLLANATKGTTSVVVHADALEGELKQVALFREPDLRTLDPSLLITIDPSADAPIEMSVDDGYSTATVDATVDGDAITFAVDYAKLLEAIAAAKATGDALVIRLTGPLTPFTVHSADVDAAGTTTPNGRTLVFQVPIRQA